MNTIVEHINSVGHTFVEFALPMLIQSSVLIAILLLVDLLLRKKVKAVFRYWIWMLVLVKLVLPTSLSSPLSLGYFFGDKLTYQDLAQSSPTLEPTVPAQADISPGIDPLFIQPNPYIPPTEPVTSVFEPAIAEPVSPPQVPVTPLSWHGVVFLVWLVVVIAMGLLLLQRALFVRGLVAQAKKAGHLMNDALAYCSASMGIKSKVGLKVSVNATTPSVCGLIRPVILVPWNLTSTLGASRLRTILMHELAHIRRGDLWVNLAQTALQIIYFYNPLLWLANCLIRRIREQSVDEAVLVAMGTKARQYPQMLVDVAKMAFKRPALSLRLIGVVESKSALAGRIKHILGRPLPKTARLGIVGVLVVIIAGAILLPMARARNEDKFFDKDLLIKFTELPEGAAKKVSVDDTTIWSKSYEVEFAPGQDLLVAVEMYQAGKPMWIPGQCIFKGSQKPGKFTVTFVRTYQDIAKKYVTHNIKFQLGNQVFKIPELPMHTPLYFSTEAWDWYRGEGLQRPETRHTKTKYAGIETLFYYGAADSPEESEDDESRFWIPGRDVTPIMSNHCIALKMMPLSSLKYLSVEPIGGYQGLDGKIMSRSLTLEKADRIAGEYKQMVIDSVEKQSTAEKQADMETDVQVEVEKTPQTVFTATLSNGVTVELVGLCEEPVGGAKWWKPDGRYMPEPFFKANKRTPPSKGMTTQYAFLAKAEGSEDISIKMKIYEGFGWSTQVAEDGTALCYIKHPNDAKPYHEDAFSQGPIEVGVAQGQWIKGRGVSSPNIQIPRSYSIGNHDEIVIQPPRPEKNSPEMATIFWFTSSSHDYEYRLICTLKDGSVEECMKPFFQSANIIETGNLKNSTLNTKSFNIDRPLEQIVNYELLYRKFDYARFNNVAFKPNAKTDVQFEVGGPNKEDAVSNQPQPELLSAKPPIFAYNVKLNFADPTIRDESFHSEQSVAFAMAFHNIEIPQADKILMDHLLIGQTTWPVHLEDNGITINEGVAGQKVLSLTWPAGEPKFEKVIKIPVKYGQKEYSCPVRVELDRRDKEAPTGSYWFCAYLSGRLPWGAGGRGFEIVNLDQQMEFRLTGDGTDPRDAVLGIDIDGDGKIGPAKTGGEQFDLYEPFQIGPKTYRLTEVDPYLPRVVFRELVSEKALMPPAKTDVQLEVEQSSSESGGGSIVVVSAGKSMMYSSIQEAIDAAPPGSVIRIGPGVYKERLEIDKPLTLEGAGWDQTTIVTENNAADVFEEALSVARERVHEAKSEEEAKKLSAELQAQFEAEMKEKLAEQTHLVSDTENVVIRNLKLTSPGQRIEGRALSVPIIKFSNARALVSGCAVVGTPGDGINIVEGSDVQIRDSLVAGVWSTGIAVAPEKGDIANARIINCDVRNCYHRGITIGAGCDSTVVEGCRVSGSSWHGIRYDNASPRIVGNLIFANVRCGIYASGETAAAVRQNLFYGNEMTGISCWHKNRDTVEANTFVGNKRSGLEVLGASMPIVRKNIFYANPTGVSCGNIGGDSTSATSDGTVNLEENLFWGFEHKVAWRHPGDTPGDTEGQVVTEEVELDEKTRNVVFDPEFKDITTEDFSLKLDSPARQSEIGAADLIDSESPWPIQDQEIPIIPEGETEDTSWMGRISSTGQIERPVVPVANQGGKKPQEPIKAKPRAQEGSEHPGRISGVVVSSVTGEPIAGAYVGVGDFGDSGGSNYSRHRSQGFHDKTKTDEKGRFELGGLVFTDKHRYLEYHPLVVTHPDFVRHDEKIELLSSGPVPDVKVSLRQAAKIDVTIVDAQGNPLEGQWLIRLEALDGRRFIPPGGDPHLSSFASSIWAHMPDLRAKMGVSKGFTFTELDTGEYLIEAIRLHLVDKPTPQNIWKPTITYHGAIPEIKIEAGQTNEVRIKPADYQTSVSINMPQDPVKKPQIPPFVLISRNTGLLLWNDGKAHGPEDHRLGRLQKNALYYNLVVEADVFTIENLPPGSYSVFAGPIYFMSATRMEVSRGREVVVDMPPIQVTEHAKVGLWTFNRKVKLQARDYSVSELCELLTDKTESNPRIFADSSIENEKLSFGKGEMSIWDVLEKLYLDKGWKVDEGADKTLIIKPAEQTDVPVDGKGTEAVSAESEVKPAASEDGPRITFESLVCDLGQVAPRTKHSCEFRFTNTGSALLKITRVHSACACTASKLKKKEYAPGESGTLKVTYQSAAHAGPVTKYVVVYCNDEVNPKVKLTIKAEIVVKVAHEPKRLNLVLDKENAGCPAITLSSLDNQPFSITGFKSTGDSITADFDPSMKKTSFVLKPKVDMEKLRKGLRGQVEIGLIHPECKEVAILFDTLAEFKVDPRVIYVREAVPQKPVTKKVRIFSNYNEDVDVESTSSKKGTVKVLTKEKVRNGCQFELQITPPAAESKARVFTDVFSVKLKSGQQLQITCYGIYSKKPAKTG